MTLNPLFPIACRTTIGRKMVGEVCAQMVAAPFPQWKRHIAVQFNTNLVIRAGSVGDIGIPAMPDQNDRGDERDGQYPQDSLQHKCSFRRQFCQGSSPMIRISGYPAFPFIPSPSLCRNVFAFNRNQLETPAMKKAPEITPGPISFDKADGLRSPCHPYRHPALPAAGLCAEARQPSLRW